MNDFGIYRPVFFLMLINHTYIQNVQYIFVYHAVNTLLNLFVTIDTSQIRVLLWSH